MAKRFFYVCAGLFLLALTYHLGARSAGAQAGGTVVGVSVSNNGSGGVVYAVATSSGDVYRRYEGAGGSWVFMGNALGAGPTPATTESWGAVKDKYRR